MCRPGRRRSRPDAARPHDCASTPRAGRSRWPSPSGTRPPATGARARARLWTLENALACSRYHNLIHRHCDLVQIACRSNLINSFCSGCIQTDNHRLYKTPTYYAQQLYATLAGDQPLKIESPLPADRLARSERHPLARRRRRDRVRGQRRACSDLAAARLHRVRRPAATARRDQSRSGRWPTPRTPASPT